MKMFVVGITGGIGSGKSAVSDFLASQGISIVDADIVAREVVLPGSLALKEIQQYFGPEVISKDNHSLDRAVLRKIIFDDASAREWLEALLHPMIRAEIIKQLENASSPYAVLTSPLLLETDQHQITQHIVVVDTTEELQVQRTMQRDNNDKDQVKAIISAQLPRTERLQHADSIISNLGSLSDLQQQSIQLHKALLLLAEGKSSE